MCNKSEAIFRCKQLILMLKRRNENPERAMEIYNKSIYESVIKEISKGEKNEKE